MTSELVRGEKSCIETLTENRSTLHVSALCCDYQESNSNGR